MRLSRFVLPAIVLAILVYLVVVRVPPEHFHRQQYFAMGTLVDITVRDSDRDKASAAMSAVGQQLNQFGLDWHPSKGDKLARVNKQIAETGVAWVPSEMEALFVRAQDISKRSGGLFDPAIGALVALWGFGSEDRVLSQPPPKLAISERVNALKPFWALEFANGSLYAPYITQLDFGAFAKGYSVDLSIDTLKVAGIKHAIVNAGGDLRVIGQHSLRKWSIGIRHPRKEGQVAFAEIKLADGEAAFTSGDYERFFFHTQGVDGEPVRYHHILDSRTGYPSSGCMSATVITNNAALADAAATALCIAGEKRWEETMESLNTPLAMLVTPEGKLLMSEAMAERVTLNSNSDFKVEIFKLFRREQR